MIEPSEVRDVQTYIEGRLTVLGELEIVGGAKPDLPTELQIIRDRLTKIQSEPVAPTVTVSRLNSLVQRYGSIYARGETVHKAEAFENLFRTLKQLCGGR